MVLPFFDVPFIELSVTAPLIVPVIYYAFCQSAAPWLSRYRGWLLAAATLWIGIAVSLVANSPCFEVRALKAVEVASIVRYLFWLTIFVVTAYIASSFSIQRRLSTLLAVAVTTLAALRCFEAMAFGKVGAWTSTVFTTQNNYGILFSTFTPYLFPLLLRPAWLHKTLAAGSLLLVLFACAVNGSRGSWICIALALSAFVVLVFVSRPSASLRLVVPLGLCALGLTLALATNPSTREAFLDRFSTFDDLEKDKSYMVRQVMNQRSLKLFSSSPWFGTGPGRYHEVYVPLEMPSILAGRSDADFMRRSAHNSYLSFLAEGGLVSSLPLALLLGALALRGGLAAITLGRRGERWALGVYASFIAMSVHFWALAGLTGTHAWFSYGLLAATIVLAARVSRPVPARPVKPHAVAPGTPLRAGIGNARIAIAIGNM